MAVISIGDVTVTVESPLAGVNLWKMVTASTVDDADTVDISSIVTTVFSCSVLGATDGLITAAVTAAGVVTIPGSTDNEARTIYVFGK